VVYFLSMTEGIYGIDDRKDPTSGSTNPILNLNTFEDSYSYILLS